MKPFLRANELAALTVKWLYHLTDDWGSANTTPSTDSPKSTHNTSRWGEGSDNGTPESFGWHQGQSQRTKARLACETHSSLRGRAFLQLAEDEQADTESEGNIFIQNFLCISRRSGRLARGPSSWRALYQTCRLGRKEAALSSPSIVATPPSTLGENISGLVMV